MKAKRLALVGRLGGTEARFLKATKIQMKYSRRTRLVKAFCEIYKSEFNKRSEQVRVNAGFYFPDFIQAINFLELYNQCLESTDILGAWGTAFASYEIQYAKKIEHLIPVPCTSPWVQTYSDDNDSIPWSWSLEGKRVLVISP